jgi:hypothetical protein
MHQRDVQQPTGVVRSRTEQLLLHEAAHRPLHSTPRALRGFGGVTCEGRCVH